MAQSASMLCVSPDYPMSLFKIPGPWLHPLTQSSKPDSTEMAKTFLAFLQNADIEELSAQNQDEITQFFKLLVEHANDSLSTYLHQRPQDGPHLRHYFGFPGGVNHPFNNWSRRYLQADVLCVLVTDTLLHIADPGNVAGPVPREDMRFDPTRVNLPIKLQEILLPLSRDFAAVLSAAEKRFRQFTQVKTERKASKPTTGSAHKLQYLNNLEKFTKPSREEPMVVNFTQAAYVLGIYLGGNVVVDTETLRNEAKLHADCLRIKITQSEINEKLDSCDLRRTLNPLLIATTISPLHLLSNHQLGSENSWAPEFFVHTWRRTGNEQRRDPTHPLSIVESLLWQQLIFTALHQKTTLEGLEAFFSDAKLLDTIEHGSREKAALSFTSDPPPPPELTPVIPSDPQLPQLDLNTLIPFDDNDNSLMIHRPPTPPPKTPRVPRPKAINPPPMIIETRRGRAKREPVKAPTPQVTTTTTQSHKPIRRPRPLNPKVTPVSSVYDPVVRFLAVIPGPDEPAISNATRARQLHENRKMRLDIGPNPPQVCFKCELFST
ncbi:hypothetical protein C8F04DRAFT_1275659 [Mycena alexandri]|uniref:Uncharacterized protein n=1 Tax=Mycena alexandri TaxID=1745969 RepID=A0AAD6S311_9AGAR|nr:hypothetical protein C8F04DRAFT_1275659 [Mycena alexandri]